MEDEFKVYELEYTYLQSMCGECDRDRKVYFLAARSESEAFAGGDELFGSISGQHKTLLGGAREVYGSGSHDYGTLSDFEKSIKECPVVKVSGPTLTNSSEFGLEPRIISNDGKTVTIEFVPKLKGRY